MEVKSEKLREMFADLGEKLQAAREAKGLSIPEVSANTRINQAFLSAIEAGEAEQLPAAAFVRGFVRNFAVALGLDGDEILDEFKRITELQGKVEMPLEPPTEVDSPRFVTLPMPKILIVAVTAVLVTWVGFLIFSSDTTSDPPPAVGEESAPSLNGEETSHGADESSEEPLANLSARAATSVAPIIAVEAQAPLPVIAPKTLQLRIRGLERTWIRLSVDRREPVDVLIEPAETGEWTADEEIRLTVGKSHGVSVYLNDEEILLPEETDRLVPEIILNKVTLLKLEN